MNKLNERIKGLAVQAGYDEEAEGVYVFSSFSLDAFADAYAEELVPDWKDLSYKELYKIYRNNTDLLKTIQATADALKEKNNGYSR